MSEPVKIVIVIEGGLVQSVLSAGVPVEYVKIDYDTEGGDVGDMTMIPQGDGLNPPESWVKAYARREQAENNGPRVLEIFAAVIEEEG